MVRVTILHGWFQEVLEEMPDDPVRLQMLLHHRDKQLDELAERFKEGMVSHDQIHRHTATSPRFEVVYRLFFCVDISTQRTLVKLKLL